MQELPKKIHKTRSKEKWRCDSCAFDNIGLLTQCQICEEPRKQLSSLPRIQQNREQRQAIITCKKCKFENSIFAEICDKCGKSVYSDEDEQRKDLTIKKQLLRCPHCSFENDKENAQCVNCEENMSALIIPRKTVKRAARKAPRKTLARGANICSCGTYLTMAPLTGTYGDCPKCIFDETTPINKTVCNFCYDKLTSETTKSHEDNCQQRLKFFDSKKNPTFERCTKLQIDTMYYMHNKCEKAHHRKMRALEDRIVKLGHKVDDLENLHHYIANYAPIIIHMHVNTHFGFFVKDTHYRNQFQTSKSSGSLSHGARAGWQDRMFDRMHHSATGFERVKYGTMNFTNDPNGVGACSGYGQSYFLLKPHVRDRCTMTDMDSSSPSSTICTFRFCYHLLMKLSDAELQSAFEGSKGKQMLSNVIGAYKEIQIHGPVQFAKDIERVYICKDQLRLGNAEKLLEQVKKFCENNKLEYELFDKSKPAPGAMLFGGTISSSSVPERIVDADDKQLKEEDIRPPPPSVPSASIFGGGFGGGFVMPPPPSSFTFAPRKVPPKRKQYGKDYI